MPPPHGRPSTASLRVIPAASRSPSSRASRRLVVGLQPRAAHRPGPSRVEWMQTNIHAPSPRRAGRRRARRPTAAAGPRTRLRLYSAANARRSRASPSSSASSCVASERRAKPRPLLAESLTGRDGDAVLVQQPLEREPVREREPDEERALAARARDRGEHAVAPPLVERAPLLDRLLRPRQRRDRGPLQRHEDPRAGVLLDEVQPCDDLGVADDEAEPPAGHAVALREREHLDADLARAVLGEEALGSAAVEDQVAVREVVDDRRARLARELDGLGEHAGRSRDGGRVRRVVEVDGGDPLARRAGPVGPAVLAERERDPLGARQRDRRVVVGVAGIGQQDPLAALRRARARARRAPSSSPAGTRPRARGRARRRTRSA